MRNSIPFGKQFLLAIIFLISSGTQAAESAQHCQGLEDPTHQPVGQQCVTSKGVLFERVQGGWLDLGDGKIWYDDLGNGMTEPESEQFCATRSNSSVPRKSDFRAADSHGFREIYRDMLGKHFWTSSAQLVPLFVGSYHGEDGGFGHAFVYTESKLAYTRCVGYQPNVR